jgi:ribosome recycling factor
MQEEFDLDEQLEMTSALMDDSIEHLTEELVKIRAGRASPAMVSGLRVAYYGTETPLPQVANITVADARSLIIQPWDKNMLQPIEKAIFEANMGVTPQNDGEIVRINIPPLTEERRRDLVKQVKSFGEDAKVSIRNVRRDAIEAIRKAVKDGYPEDAGKRGEDQVQRLTDEHTKRVEQAVEAKEKDIMTI